jgi:DNA polymerase III delta prime subunit
MNKHIPWVEKYRPTDLADVVLDKTNKRILVNIIEKNYFPNLLLYGPPGTGKTTTIINLIDKYQETYDQKRKGLKIHLNASDDRGIDIIRNQINQFVNTKTLFGNGIKFVILDEVDYMTKNAQQALRYLIQQYGENIRFCLICNYISRIDSALQNEFIRLRFCQLPESEIYTFLENIKQKENLSIKKNQLLSIQKLFKSDIRSMINFIQSNHELFNNSYASSIITETLWEDTIEKIKTMTNIEKIVTLIKQNAIEYNLDDKDLIIAFISYLTENKEYAQTKNWLQFFKFIVHNIESDKRYIYFYFVSKLQELYKSL